MAVNFGGLAPPAENLVLQSFSDATAGRSLMLYWGVAMEITGGTSYALARDPGTSYPLFRTGASTSDFDITINKSTIFSGIGYVDVKMTIASTGGANSITGSLYYDDGSESLISNEPAITISDNGTYNLKLPLTVVKKHFKPGDILRLKVVLTVTGGTVIKLFHDPLTAGDELKLWMPVVNLE